MSSTLSLIRQDPARGGFIRAIISCVAAGGMLRIAPDLGEEIGRLTLHDLPGGFVPFYLLLTGMVATFVLGANAWTRSSRLALGLPLSTRKVWAVRTGSLAAVALLSVAALAFTIGISLDSETWNATMNPSIALAAARAAATALLLLFLYQLPQSERDRIPIGPPYVVYVIGASLFTLVISAVQITSLVGTLVLLAIATALGIYLYFRLPTTFSAGPTLEESETPVWSMPDESDLTVTKSPGDERLPDAHRHPALALHWVLFRGLKTNVLAWFLILIVGSSAAVVTLEFFKGTNAFLPLFFLILYHLPLLQTALENMSPFDPLPISRRILWAHSAGPIIASAAVGAIVGLSIFALNHRSFTQIQYSECCVKVPWDYLELSSEGQAPAIDSPWGETYTPKAHPLWRGQAVAIYDPYEVGPDSSERFAQYQARRAIETIHGTGFTLESARGHVPPDRIRTAAVALLVLTVLVTFMVISALLQYGSSVHRKIFKRASIGGLVLLVVIVVAVSLARLLGFTEVWFVGALLSIGIRSLAQTLPLPTTFLWILCVTSWAGAYLLLERIFFQIEFPREKTMNRFAEEY
jgi:hypothetical protein